MAEAAKTLRVIAEYAGKRGLRVTVDEEKGTLIIEHGEYPLRIVVEPSGDGYVVELRSGDNMESVVEELLGEEVDPREELEGALESLVEVVDYAVRKLEEAGFQVSKKTREAILDVYDAIESFLEEEE